MAENDGKVKSYRIGHFRKMIQSLGECGCLERMCFVTVPEFWPMSVRSDASRRYAWLVKRHVILHHRDVHDYLSARYDAYRAIHPVEAPHQSL